MYSAASFSLTKSEYDYLLPALRKALYQSGDGYFYISYSIDSLGDMLNRLKGLYDNYDDIKAVIVYNCSKNKSLTPFRESIGINLTF